jgi:predicted NAD/FAD-dependent oxidoreductase
VAVVGAGISGLTAARIIHDHGHRVQVFEKGRGHGGRAATRRVDGLAFDHGAQYFTARNPTFRRAVAAWRERGLVDVWPLRIGRVAQGQIQPSPDTRERLVAVPGMSTLGRHLAADLSIRNEVQIAAAQRIDGRWRLNNEAGNSLGEFELLILAVPAPQAQPLLAPIAPHLSAQAATVEYESIWAVLLAFECSEHLATNALFIDSGPLHWAAEDSSKPRRKGHNWVLHATPEWSRERLRASPEQVAGELGANFCAVTGLDPAAIGYRAAHRWRYSKAVNPLSVGALWNQELGLGVCGDWCHGSRIEGAYLSGQAVAGHLLRNLSLTVPDASAAENRKTADDL